MLHCKLPSNSLVWEVLEHLRQQIDTSRVEVGHDVGPGLQFIQLEVRLPVWQLGDGWPSCLARRAEDLEDFLQLVGVRVAREEGPAVDHFCEDAADAPNVHRCGVFSRTHEHVRRAVPQCDHLMGVTPHWNAEGTCKAEVGQLQCSLPVDEEVLWLQVAVKHAMLMAVRDAPQQLVEERLRGGSVQAAVAGVEQLFQVLIQVLEH
mmetsp:Transcript_10999/g.22366  ORF Transcript_10999/g.22366 Transcript_10999/m.22366 type:complete len:205 (-) Transcript_10999:308-922(-)